MFVRATQLSIALMVGFLAAVAQHPSTEQRVAELKQSLAANQAALRQYTWIETTQVSLKGEVRKTEQKQVYFGADGKQVKTPLPGTAPAPAPPPQAERRGRLKEKIVENKKEETAEYMQQVAALIHQYVPPSGDRIQAARAAGNVSMEPAAGATTLTIKDYVKAGDSVSLGFNPETQKLLSYSVNSYVDDPKDAVQMTVTFSTLADGVSYPAQSVLNLPNKNMEVKISNAGYRKGTP